MGENLQLFLCYVIFSSCEMSSLQTCLGCVGEQRKAVQVYIRSRWLIFFLEWFISTQTLRGQSKHKATLSNLLHPLLQHSSPNSSGLLRMTMNRALTELFAQPYIDVKHMPGLSQSPHFISLEHLRDSEECCLKPHFPPSSTPKGWNFSWRSCITPSNRKKFKRLCVRKARREDFLAAFGNPTLC